MPNGGSAGGYRQDFAGPAFGGASTGAAADPYEVAVTSVEVAPTNGACDSACAQVTSCSYGVTVTLKGSGSSTAGNFVGLVLTITPPADTTASTATAVPSVTTKSYDPESGVFAFDLAWSWVLTVTPTCAVGSLTVTLSADDFAVASGWSKSDGASSADVALVFGCTPCDGTKYVSTTTQATGRNAKTSSIDVTTLASTQAAAAALAASNPTSAGQ